MGETVCRRSELVFWDRCVVNKTNDLKFHVELTSIFSLSPENGMGSIETKVLNDPDWHHDAASAKGFVYHSNVDKTFRQTDW